jgi:hypothetical protein
LALKIKIGLCFLWGGEFSAQIESRATPLPRSELSDCLLASIYAGTSVFPEVINVQAFFTNILLSAAGATSAPHRPDSVVVLVPWSLLSGAIW